MILLARLRNFAPLALILLSVAIAVGAYLQVLNAPFVSDDELYISGNTRLAALHVTELWRLFVQPYNGFNEFLPLRDLSYWLDMTLYGLTPAAFRISNLIMYLLCMPLVYSITTSLWRYFRPADAASATWAAAAVTALFVLHPSHVEAVVWISGRKDVLAALFSLLALWCAVNSRREQGLAARYAFAAMAALLAAMLSKASAVAVAPVIALLWLIYWREIATGVAVPAKAQTSKIRGTKSPKCQEAPARHYAMLWWPFAIIFLAVCVALIFASIIKTRVPFYFGIEAVTRTLAVMGWLTRLTVSPESRHFFYPVFEDPFLLAMVILGLIVLIAAVVSMVMVLRKRSLAGFALVAFVLLCIPSIQLIPYSPPSLVSDRWLALAVWPIILIVVALTWRLKPVPRAALLLIIALAWSFQTIERSRDWQSTEAMIDADMHAFSGYDLPSAYKVVNQLSLGEYRAANETAGLVTVPEFQDILIGMIKVDQAVHVDAVATGSPDEAIKLIRDSWAEHQQMPAQAQWNSPISFLWGKRLSLFKGEWESLMQQFTDDMQVSYAAGLWMLEAHQFSDSIDYLRAAAESQQLPLFQRGTAYYNLGFGLMNTKRFSEAERSLRLALEQTQSDNNAYCLLAALYQYTGRSTEATSAEADCRQYAR